MGRIPKYRQINAERWAQATGTTPVSLLLDRGDPNTPLTIINSIIASTVNGTLNGASTITINDVVVVRETLPTIGNSYTTKIDIDGSWPIWRNSNLDVIPLGVPKETFVGPPPGTGTTYPIYGGSAASGELNQRAGQSFLMNATAYIDSIAFRLRKIGNPTDTFRVTIRDTSITGGVLATIEVNSADISELGSLYQFRLTTPIQLITGTTYYVQLLRLGTRNTTNYIEAYQVSTASLYADGGAYTFDNNVWSAESATDDLTWSIFSPVEVIYTPPAGSTSSSILVTYHHEKPSRTRN